MFKLTNPFSKKVLYDESDFEAYPFILTNTLALLKNKIEVMIKDGETDYILLLGERGIGKTTTLLFLKKLVEKTSLIKTKYFRSVKGFGNLFGIVSQLSPDRRVSFKESPKSLEDFLRKDEYFFFIDVPDEINLNDLRNLSRGLEILLGFNNISIVIAMNKSHYLKLESITEILGKYMVWNLRPFNLDETKKLIIERMKLSDRYNEENPLYPFDEKSVEIIHGYSKGIPRNILSACDLLFQIHLLKNIKIDESIAKNELQFNYAEKIINERLPEHQARFVLDLWKLIISQGKKISEKELHKLIEEKFGWSYVTRRKRIRMLEKLGLIKIDKDPVNNWSNIIEVI